MLGGIAVESGEEEEAVGGFEELAWVGGDVEAKKSVGGWVNGKELAVLSIF